MVKLLAEICAKGVMQSRLGFNNVWGRWGSSEYCHVEQAVGYHIRRGVCEQTVQARYTEIRGIH